MYPAHATVFVFDDRADMASVCGFHVRTSVVPRIGQALGIGEHESSIGVHRSCTCAGGGNISFDLAR